MRIHKFLYHRCQSASVYQIHMMSLTMFLLGFLRSFKAALSSTSPLVFLGFARIISTWGVDYQVLFLFLCTNYLHYYLLISVIHYNGHIHGCAISLYMHGHSCNCLVSFSSMIYNMIWFTMPISSFRYWSPMYHKSTTYLLFSNTESGVIG